MMAAPPPPTPRSLNAQRVLDEDEYTEALSHIIARDFYPSLVAHLDASPLHSQDTTAIAATAAAADTPFGHGPSDTPRGVYGAEGVGEDGPMNRKRARFDVDLSLDAFQARYTSEDNSSFTQVLDEENRKRKERWAWAWEAQKKVEAQRAKALEARERMMIMGAPAPGVREKILIEAPKPIGLLTDKETEDEEDEERQKQLVAIIQKDEEQVDVLAPKKDTREAGVDGWKFKARNSLMFHPDADVSPYKPPLNDNPKDLRVIKHSNTRLLSRKETPAIPVPPSPTQSRIDALITGTPYRPRSPTLNTSSLVPNLPSPTPAELGPVAVKELMTWGTINATPRILSEDDDPVPIPSTPFHIPAPSSREVIGQKLSTGASKSLRAKAEMLGLSLSVRSSGLGIGTPSSGKKAKGTMPPPGWTPRKADAPGNLTPAAKRLLDRTTLGTKRRTAW